MAEALLDALGPVLTRWTMGGSALPSAPAAWRDALGTEAGEAELRLLALSGQLLGALTIAAPDGQVRSHDDIPALSRPPLPGALRPRACRLLQTLPDAGARRTLLDFLASRGWTLHPGDWMPRPGEDVPGIYAPWQDWAAAGSPTPAAETLTAESWDGFGPAARHAAFTALRRRDPARAGALLMQKIAGETPDRRVRLLDVLAMGLSDADRPLLESLSGDRAPRVKALAASLMARLGGGEAGGDDAAELAGFFTIQTSGLWRRTRTVVSQTMRTRAQHDRRTALFGMVSFDGFARALDWRPEELIAAWSWGDPSVDRPFAAMLARSAADAIVAAAIEAMTATASIDPQSLTELLARLTQPQRRQAAIRLLRADAGFAVALTIAGGGADIDDAIDLPAGAALMGALAAETVGRADQAMELVALGLLASRAGAKRALDRLAAAGLIAADPRLDMLRLNAALEYGRPAE